MGNKDKTGEDEISNLRKLSALLEGDGGEKSALLLNAMLFLTDDLVFCTRKNGGIFYANPAAHTALNYPPGGLYEKNFFELLDDEQTTELPEQPSFKAIFKTEGKQDVIASVQWKSINEEYCCFVVKDLTEQLRREKELEQAKKEIESLSEQLREESLPVVEAAARDFNFNNIITRSTKYHKILEQVAQVADSDATVLITGETGTGKELLARAIYSLSNRVKAPFIKVNCASLPNNLIESELFGHEKGAYTGAVSQRKGRFEIADKGTIFLDEIGELPLALQSKLLRVLQEGEFERLGGTKTLKVDVRIIAATNRDLKKMMQNGTFREDLFYRLNVFPIHNMPLRDRPEDIPVLVRYFIQKYSAKTGKTVESISKSDLALLQRYDYPGNIRELENLIERAIILSKGKKLNIKDSFQPSRHALLPDQEEELISLEENQRRHIIKALKRTRWRVTGPHGAARLLGLKDRTLMSKMRRLGIKRTPE